MEHSTAIVQTAQYVRSQLDGEGSGHDWWHIFRVWQNAKAIGRKEPVNMLVVELAALLHDIADHKFHGGDDTIGPRVAGEWLLSLHVDNLTSEHVQQIISQVSFKKGQGTKPATREGQVVQDADRLDAVGAIGIARAFATGAQFGDIFFDPDAPERTHTVIGHFHEKLLRLKDLMNTPTAKTIASDRHQFMLEYLERFHQEWQGKQ